MNLAVRVAGLLTLLLVWSARDLCAEPVFRSLSCDSLRLTLSVSDPGMPELDSGNGFVPLDCPPGASCVLPLPGFGGGLALRYRLADDRRGLPAYSREWTWSRPWPRFLAEVRDSQLRLSVVDKDACIPAAWILRVESGGMTTDIRRVETAETARVALADMPWHRLLVSWKGAADQTVIEVAMASRPSADQVPQHRPHSALPSPPRLAGISGDTLLFEVQGRAILAKGDGHLLPGSEAGTWKLLPGRTMGTELMAEDAAGRRSLPFLWDPEPRLPRPVLDRTGPASLGFQLETPLEDARLTWVDARGRTGRIALQGQQVELRDLAAGPLRLELTIPGQDNPLWSRQLEFVWPASSELIASAASDSLIRLELNDPRGWASNWRLEQRLEHATRRLGTSPSHQIRTGGLAALWLRWKSGEDPHASSWSAWRRIDLLPQVPANPRVLPSRHGTQLVWDQAGLVKDRVEIERVLAGDTLRWVVPEREPILLDNVDCGGCELSYRLRRVAHWHSSPWSENLALRLPGRSRELFPLLVQDVALYNLDRGGIRDTKSLHAAEPARGISAREVMSYCNWLNQRLGHDARYDVDNGLWTRGATGGYRLPHRSELAELSGTGDLRHWLLEEGTARLAGSSPLRSRGSARRGYSLDAAPPDAGALILLDGVE